MLSLGSNPRRTTRTDAARFGPFASSWSLRSVIQLQSNLSAGRARTMSFDTAAGPCILYQMEQCSTAPASAKSRMKITPRRSGEAVRVLEGKSDAISKSLERRMQRPPKRRIFEEAALCEIRPGVWRQSPKFRARLMPHSGTLSTVTSRRSHAVAAQPRRFARRVAPSAQWETVRGWNSALSPAKPSSPAGRRRTPWRPFLAQAYFQVRKQEDPSESPGGLRGLEPVSLPDTRRSSARWHFVSVRGESEFDTQLLRVADSNARYSLELGSRRNQRPWV